MKQVPEFLQEVSSCMDVELKDDQLEALRSVYQFLFLGGPRSVFILRGYAGTGKTTLMGGLIRWFHSINRKTALLAPTGRSAKVLSALSGYPASTIHRRIYAVKESEFGKPALQLVQNRSERTIYIVDEASMIGESNVDDSFVSRSLLEDLFEHVYGGERCRLILIGDDAQLPPVGMDLSPALDKDRLAQMTGATVYQSVLTEVVRQQRESLILENATRIRQQINEGDFDKLCLGISIDADISDVDSYELEDLLSTYFQGQNAHESVLICRSNKDANQFNKQIRSRILFRESEIEAGDRLMIVKNNYHWEIPGRRQSFLANGDMVTVERIQAQHVFGPFRFAEAQVYFSDDPGQSFDLVLLLNPLDFDGPSIPGKELLKLREILIDEGEIDPNEASEKFFQNPYFQAVQVKYAYAVTCHKSQGGQWANVLIYQGYFTAEMMDRSYFRWLYTALTRATSHVYLINFQESLLQRQ